MPFQSTSVQPLVGLPVITTRPPLGSGCWASRSLGFFTFISAQYLMAVLLENAIGLLWPLS